MAVIGPVLGCRAAAGEPWWNPVGGKFGAVTRPPTEEEIATCGLGLLLAGRVNGRIISSVEKGSAADYAGVAVGDAVLALDENLLYSADDLEDFLRAARSKQKVILTRKRPGAMGEEKIELVLGYAPDPTEPRIDWRFAGPAQLDAARAQARKEGKRILVGLSGAET